MAKGNDNAGKISRTAFVAASIVLFAISIIGSILRIVIRVHYQKRLYVDDFFLLLAVVCLCAATVILFNFVPQMYFVEALVTNDPNLLLPSNFIDEAIQFQRLTDAFLILTYTTIFAVKFSFLFFFRILTDRVHKMVVYWWVVTACTAVVWAYGIAGIFVTCPYFDARSINCAQASQFPTALGLAASMIALDIFTDLIIMVIPIRMLWNMHIKLRQKLVIGITLCLSIITMITAIIQVSGIRTDNSVIDISWEIFWQLAEATVAVTMVSLTALRSLFIGHSSRSPSPGQSWSSRQKRYWKRALLKRSSSTEETTDVGALPEIPGATLTGMRTLIRGGRPHTLSSGTSVMQSRAWSVSPPPLDEDPLALPPLVRPHSRAWPLQDTEKRREDRHVRVQSPEDGNMTSWFRESIELD